MVKYASRRCFGNYEIQGVREGSGIVGVIKLSGQQNNNTIDGLITPFILERQTNKFHCNMNELWFYGKKELLESHYIGGIPKELNAELKGMSLKDQETTAIPIKKLKFSKDQLRIVEIITENFEVKFDKIMKLLVCIYKRSNMELSDDDKRTKYDVSVNRRFVSVPEELMKRAKEGTEIYSLLEVTNDKQIIASKTKFKPALSTDVNPIPTWIYGRIL